MNAHKLKVFITAVEAGSFLRAADILKLSHAASTKPAVTLRQLTPAHPAQKFWKTSVSFTRTTSTANGQQMRRLQQRLQQAHPSAAHALSGMAYACCHAQHYGDVEAFAQFKCRNGEILAFLRIGRLHHSKLCVGSVQTVVLFVLGTVAAGVICGNDYKNNNHQKPQYKKGGTSDDEQSNHERRRSCRTRRLRSRLSRCGLKVFITAVEAGSFLRAADILGYTPSGVTHMIHRRRTRSLRNEARRHECCG